MPIMTYGGKDDIRHRQHLHRRHSVANTNLHKSHSWHFYANSHTFGDIKVWNVWPWKFRSRPRVHYSQWSHSMMNINDYKSKNWAFSLALTVFHILADEMLGCPWKCRSMTQSTIFTMTLFNGKHMTYNSTAIIVTLLWLSPFTRYSQNK